MIKNLHSCRGLLLCLFISISFKGYSQAWTWVKGTNSVNIGGTYGTQNIAFGANTPGSRSSAAQWTDNSGNLWMFGGDGYDINGSGGKLNDLWKYNVTTNEWTWVRGNNIINQPGIYGTQNVASSTSNPGSRSHCVSWKDASGNFWLYGGEGFGASGGNANLSDLWKFDVTTLQWTWMKGASSVLQVGVYGTQGVSSPSNLPSSRRVSRGWADNNGNLWMLGGYGYASAAGENFLNDLWKYNIASNEWTWMKGSNSWNAMGSYGTLGTANAANNPGARYGFTAWVDNSNNLWMYGGNGYDGGSTAGYLEDIWKYNTTTNMWTWVDGSNIRDQLPAGVMGVTSTSATPGGRYYSSSWTDVSGNIYLQGGAAVPGYMNDLWKYNITTNNWTWIRGNLNLPPVYGTQGATTSLSEPGAGYLRMAWKDNSNNMWLFGGVAQDVNYDMNNLNELWKITLPAAAPTASFSLSQAANICQGTRLILTDYSTNSPASRAYSIDGTIWSYDPNPVVQNGTLTISAGTHTISLISTNESGASAPFTRTISISGLSATTITRTPGGSTVKNIGSGQTNMSDWAPWVYTFADPLPAGTIITRVDITYDGVDQGSGGTGAPGVIHFADREINNQAFSHSWNSFSKSVVGTFPKYNYGGNNTVKLYFWGYPGWQAHVANMNLTIFYETVNITVCTGGSVTLNASSGSATRVWTGGITEGVAFVPASSGVYTVTSTDINGCSNTNTIAVTIDAPTISVFPGEMCKGSSFTLVPTGALTYTYSGGANVVTPTVNTTYSVTGKSKLGCPATNTAVVTVTVNPTPTLTIASGTICSGNTFTLSMSGAFSYTSTAPSATVSPATNTTYVTTGTDSKGCVSGAITSSVTISIPVISVNSGGICPGNVFTLSPSGASTYTYSNGSNTVSPSTATNYSVTGTDVFGCIASMTAVSTVSMHPVPAVVASNGTICAGSSLTISPSGAVSYSFSSGSAIVSPPSTTNYSVTGSNSLGCVSAPAVVNVSVNALPVISINSGSICNGGSYAITPGGASTYTFLNGSGVVSPTITSTYSVIGTSSLNCISSNTAVSTVTVNPLPVIAVNAGTLCSGKSFTITPTGVNTYTFLNGSSIVSPSVTSSYSITGSSSFGCVSSNTAVSTLTVYTSPTVGVNSGTICSGNPYTITPTGAVNYTFLSGSAVVSPLSLSSYSIVGESSFGCLSANTAIATVTVNPLPVIGINSGAICTGSSYTIVPTGAATYTFLNGSSVVAPTASTSYSVIGKSNFGCLSANPAIASVVVNPLPVLAISGLLAVCSGSAISQTISGADTYTWNTGATSTVISVSPTVITLYSVTGTNTLTGCFATTSKMINVGNPPVVTINGGNVCAGSSFTFTPAGAFTYTISNGTQTISPVISPTTNSSYFVSGTSSLGCVSSNTAISNIIINALPVIVVNSGGVCMGKTFTMTPTGAGSYTFSNGSSTVIPTANTSYSVTGTNVLGCVSSAPGIANVTVNPIPTITAGNGTVCTGSLYNIIPGGASSYTYISASGPVSAWVSPSANTNYSISGTNAQGCVSGAPSVITVSVIALPTVTVNSSTVCAGGIFTMVPSGASTYTYSTGSATVAPTANASYSVSGTNLYGCVSSGMAVANVTLITAPTVSVNSGAMCAGAVFTLIPSGASTYTFSSGSATVSPNANTSYTVKGSNAQGCESANFATANVLVNPGPVLSILGNTTICEGESTSLLLTGANSYSWNGVSQGALQSLSPITNTTYTVSGSGSNNCVRTETVSITVNPLPVISLNSGTVCPMSSFTILASGAQSYTYSGGSNVVTPAVTTVYSITGTGANGCISSPRATTITVINSITVSVSGTTVLCAGNQATLTANGAATYTWNTGATGNTLLTSSATSSVYTVIGANGTCADTVMVPVQINALPVLNAASTSTLICAGETATLSVSGATSYVWSGGETTSIITISPGITTHYSVTGTDLNGCSNETQLLQSVSNCLGIEPFRGNSPLVNLYPNPNSGSFVVESPRSMSMTVRNTLGQIVLTGEISEGKNLIELSEQVKGIYFIELKAANEHSAIIKVIKQ